MRNAIDDGPPVPIEVSRHACRRYRERVDGSASDADVRARLLVELQDAGPADGSGYPPDRPIALAVEGEYVAILVPGDPPTVATVWRWSESPHLLKRKGGPEVGARHYRWLNDGLSGATADDLLDRIDRMEHTLARISGADTVEDAQTYAREALAR